MKPSKENKAGLKYVAANGGELDNKGELDVIFKDPHDNMRSSTFQNAEVGMPIFSISRLTKEKHEVTVREHDGYILHVPNGERFYVVKASGVYFIKMKAPRGLVLDGGFGRHGEA